MLILVRAITYSTLFVGFLLVFLPRQVLVQAGAVAPTLSGPFFIAGAIITATGSALALWCIVSFVTLGKGTPLPFDPPRKLVIRGPYRLVRNPMYLGAAMALGGAAMIYRSLPLVGYLLLFFLAMNGFVFLYEEPALGRTFGEDYARYRATVPRWIPRLGLR